MHKLAGKGNAWTAAKSIGKKLKGSLPSRFSGNVLKAPRKVNQRAFPRAKPKAPPTRQVDPNISGKTIDELPTRQAHPKNFPKTIDEL